MNSNVQEKMAKYSLNRINAHSFFSVKVKISNTLSFIFALLVFLFHSNNDHQKKLMGSPEGIGGTCRCWWMGHTSIFFIRRHNPKEGEGIREANLRTILAANPRVSAKGLWLKKKLWDRHHLSKRHQKWPRHGESDQSTRGSPPFIMSWNSWFHVQIQSQQLKETGTSMMS